MLVYVSLGRYTCTSTYLLQTETPMMIMNIIIIQRKTGKNSISFHILTATLGKMATPRSKNLPPQCWSSDTHRRRHHCWDGTTSGCGREDHHAAAGVDAWGQLPQYRSSGWWLTYPSEKYARQLGWWHSKLNGKIKSMFQTTNQSLTRHRYINS